MLSFKNLQVRAHRHCSLPPRPPDPQEEDRAEAEAEGAAGRGPCLLWGDQEHQGVAQQGKEESVNRISLNKLLLILRCNFKVFGPTTSVFYIKSVSLEKPLCDKL